MRRRWLGLGSLTAAITVATGTFVAADSRAPTEHPRELAGAEAVATATPPAPSGKSPDGANRAAATPSSSASPPATAASPSTTVAPASPPPPRTPVVPHLEAALGDPALAGRKLAVAVVDAHSKPVFEFHADASLLPASTMKLVTAAAALQTLGPGFQYVTHLNATAAPRADGVLDGSLVLVGAGDPMLGTPAFGSVTEGRPRTPLEALADRVAALGIRRVTGNVLADPWIFPDQPTAPGWYPAYIADGDASRVSGLTVNGGRRVFRGGQGQVASEPAANPATEAAVSLRDLLRKRGVHVDGGAGVVRKAPPAPVPVGAVASHPMAELLQHMVQKSDNRIADAVFRTVGHAVGRNARWDASAVAVRRSLEPLGLDWSAVAVYDGSGLSRHNRLRPDFLAGLDAVMTRSAHGALWQDLMAMTGVRGTLQRRLVGSLAQGRVIGKTGTLRDVKSLAGTVTGPGGRYHFAVIGNALDRDGRLAVQRLQDRVALTLARDLEGCFVAPHPACER